MNQTKQTSNEVMCKFADHDWKETTQWMNLYRKCNRCGRIEKHINKNRGIDEHWVLDSVVDLD